MHSDSPSLNVALGELQEGYEGIQGASEAVHQSHSDSPLARTLSKDIEGLRRIGQLENWPVA